MTSLVPTTGGSVLAQYSLSSCQFRLLYPSCDVPLKPHIVAAPPWQDILVGGTVFGVVGAALAAGLKKDPIVCELCQGNGGTR